MPVFIKYTYWASQCMLEQKNDKPSLHSEEQFHISSGSYSLQNCMVTTIPQQRRDMKCHCAHFKKTDTVSDLVV